RDLHDAAAAQRDAAEAVRAGRERGGGAAVRDVQHAGARNVAAVRSDERDARVAAPGGAACRDGCEAEGRRAGEGRPRHAGAAAGRYGGARGRVALDDGGATREADVAVGADVTVATGRQRVVRSVSGVE